MTASSSPQAEPIGSYDTSVNSKYQIKNYETISKDKKQWQTDNAEKIKKSQRKCHLKRKFGISIDEYNEMFDKQNGCCAICGRHQSKITRILAIKYRFRCIIFFSTINYFSKSH